MIFISCTAHCFPSIFSSKNYHKYIKKYAFLYVINIVLHDGHIGFGRLSRSTSPTRVYRYVARLLAISSCVVPTASTLSRKKLRRNIIYSVQFLMLIANTMFILHPNWFLIVKMSKYRTKTWTLQASWK